MTGLVLVTGLLVVLVTGAVPAVYAAEPDPATSWAGSRAGEGRERPGRQDAEPVEPEDDAYAPPEEPPPVPDATGVPEPSQDAALPVPAVPPGAGTVTSEEPVLQVLSLGSGLMLLGLGLGLAFVGLRIRRD
ncbi:hypothetical protein OG250_21210 [Streptomyces sp. NBC_00487]|uniref:hypothetical protein n=1 Tax=unclassified Streptomyces TaxID=2593676 RepID=UPI002DDC721C|nr:MULTISPECIES: hypothetical protein [unclassified Streptomyces]WRY97158.1 hypothetical protein OG889_21955 [Streptomyces sp. NBC_00481]